MSQSFIAVPSLVQNRANALGSLGVTWLKDLPDLIAELERRWSISVGEPIDGGTSSYVAHARTVTGEDAVLKLAVPDRWVRHEIQLLQAAAGNGYSRLVESDVESGALLVEAQGPSMYQLKWSMDRSIPVLCETFRQAWTVEFSTSAHVQTGRSKADSLAELIDRSWKNLDQPCSPTVIETALRYTERRSASYSEDRCVVVHGDPHPGNALRVRQARPGAESGFVLVDPEPFFAEAEYDLGVVLREGTDEYLGGSARELARRRCSSLAKHSGLDGDAVWEWGFVERVSTGLFVLELGDDGGLDYLRVAERLV